MEALRETPQDRAMRYCPPYAAPRKTGRPKIDRRIKSPLEVNKQRKTNERVDDLPAPRKGKHVGKRGGKVEVEKGGVQMNAQFLFFGLCH